MKRVLNSILLGLVTLSIPSIGYLIKQYDPFDVSSYVTFPEVGWFEFITAFFIGFTGMWFGFKRQEGKKKKKEGK